MRKKQKIHAYQNRSRRNFIKTVTGGAASLALLSSCEKSSENQTVEPPVETDAHPPRTNKTNPYVTGEGKPILVCVTGTNFTEMLREGLSELGGLSRLINSNQNVLVKPNLNHRDPFPGISSPDSIADIVREVAATTSGTVTVADEGYENPTSIYNYLGLDSYVSEAGGNLKTFSTDFHYVRRNSWESSKPNFQVFSEVYQSPIIINTCVIKRHANAVMTCALKCNVGSIRGTGMSISRNYLHYASPNFLMEVAEIAGLVNPELTIVDARSILTRNGPQIYMGDVVDGVNKIIICGDMVATDAYCAKILEKHDENFDISMISETLGHGVSLGLGTRDLSQVEVVEINS